MIQETSLSWATSCVGYKGGGRRHVHRPAASVAVRARLLALGVVAAVQVTGEPAT